MWPNDKDWLQRSSLHSPAVLDGATHVDTTLVDVPTQHVSTQHLSMCRHIDMCRCAATTTRVDVPSQQHVSMCRHKNTCRCADTTTHVDVPPTQQHVSMCRHNNKCRCADTTTTRVDPHHTTQHLEKQKGSSVTNERLKFNIQTLLYGNIPDRQQSWRAVFVFV